MSQDSALREAAELKAALLAHGVPRVSIELQPGRPTSGDRWDCLKIVADMSHHIESTFDAGNLTPFLNMCKQGRAGLPGPLCNMYGGWDLTARILTFGLANHPGKGGSISVPGFRIPRDSARRYAWGTEYEGGIKTSDWDRPLASPAGGTMTMREFMGRCNAGVQSHFGLTPDAHLEHVTWAPGRKFDRLGYTRAEGAEELAQFLDPARTRASRRGVLPHGAVVDLSNVLAAAAADPPAPDGHFTHRDDVIVVERALSTEGLLDPRFADGSYGTSTIAAYAAWQRSPAGGGSSGPEVDGRPGETSLRRLGERHNFTVTA